MENQLALTLIFVLFDISIFIIVIFILGEITNIKSDSFTTEQDLNTLYNLNSNVGGVSAYFCTITTATNAPDVLDTAGVLFSFSRKGSVSSLIYQLFVADDQTIWQRTGKTSGAGATWSSWQQIYDTSLLTNSTMLGQLANALGAFPNAVTSTDGTSFLRNNFDGNDGIFLFGAYSTDGMECSLYMGSFKMNEYSPTSYASRLNNSALKCELNSNDGGTLAVSNPTSGKSYVYYGMKLVSL